MRPISAAAPGNKRIKVTGSVIEYGTQLSMLQRAQSNVTKAPQPAKVGGWLNGSDLRNTKKNFPVTIINR